MVCKTNSDRLLGREETIREGDRLELCKPQIKICGLTSIEEVMWVVEEKADYAGFVMYFPQSKRNITPTQAKELLAALKKATAEKDAQAIQSVAVVVSPSVAQIKEIQCLGFDLIQIHGTIEPEQVKAISVPVIRAINVQKTAVSTAEQSSTAQRNAVSDSVARQIAQEKQLFEGKLEACLFDAVQPGSGEVFDWTILPQLKEAVSKLILAGGLDASNVAEAIATVKPDVVDVSSGVEIAKEMVGKDHNKIKQFIRKVREDE
jgi:phosphoribosylanthranilate isomerase